MKILIESKQQGFIFPCDVSDYTASTSSNFKVYIHCKLRIDDQALTQKSNSILPISSFKLKLGTSTLKFLNALV